MRDPQDVHGYVALFRGLVRIVGILLAITVIAAVIATLT